MNNWSLGQIQCGLVVLNFYASMTCLSVPPGPDLSIAKIILSDLPLIIIFVDVTWTSHGIP